MMNRAVKFAAASLFSILVHSQANAATVAFTGSGTFTALAQNQNGCSGCSITNNGTVLDMSGINNSTLTANSISSPSGGYNVTGFMNDVTIGQLTWVNKATTGNADTNFNVKYTYSLSFSGQQNNYSATVAIVMGVITMIIAYVVQLRGMRKGA